MLLWLLVVLNLVVASLVWAWCRRQLRAADELQKAGFVCIGWNFITGPIMAPDTSRLRTHL